MIIVSNLNHEVIETFRYFRSSWRKQFGNPDSGTTIAYEIRQLKLTME